MCLGGHSLLSGSYGICLWRQVVVRIEAEVLRKWDKGDTVSLHDCLGEIGNPDIFLLDGPGQKEDMRERSVEV